MADLTASIVAHAALGVFLAALVWATGYGWLRLLRRRADWLAYPAGLIVAIAASWLALVHPLLWLPALLLVAPAVLELRRPLRALLPAVPFALGLGLALGLLLHGPTETEESHAYGDMLVLASKLASARESVVPYRDLLVEGEPSTYIEAGSSFVGAALGLVDPILFQAATLPAFLIAALAIGLARATPRADPHVALALAPLAVAVVAYPTWITESPPVALALPLAFALFHLLHERVGVGELAAAVGLIGVGFALTKGFGAIQLLVAATIAAAGLRDRIDLRRALLAVVPLLVLGVVAVAFFVATSSWLTDLLDFKFLPRTAVEGALDQLDQRDTQRAAPALLIGGQLLLLAAFVRTRAWPVVAVMVTAVLGNWFVGGHSFDITLGLAIVIALIDLSQRPEVLRAQMTLVVAAGAALALSAMFRDISGLRAGVTFALLLGAGVVAVLAASAWRVYAPLAAVALAAAALLGAGGLAQGGPTLYPEHYDIWREVRDRVPEHGLVFTDETGPIITGTQGWNYYPGVARRQVYVAGWSSSPLLVHEAERARRLRLNAEVLRGRDPRTLRYDRRYESFYAVVGGEAPAAWRRLHANDRFALYEIP